MSDLFEWIVFFGILVQIFVFLYWAQKKLEETKASLRLNLKRIDRKYAEAMAIHAFAETP